ncbi:MAG: TolC family protein [Bacteroidia bacterium]
MINTTTKKIIFGSLFLLTLSFDSKAQADSLKLYTDTVHLDMNAVEQRFVSKSLVLIAAKYNVDIAQANVLQAKLWYNPNISVQTGFYDPITHSFFNRGDNGNVDAQIQQEFSIVGKYTNTVRLAKLSADEAELAFEDVIRSLKLQLHTDYGNILYLQQQINVFHRQQSELTHLIESSEQMFKLGAASGDDVLRLKAELNDLENQEINTLSNMNNAQADMKILLCYSATTYISLSDITHEKNTLPPFTQIVDSTLKSRPDILLANKDVDLQRMNVKLQKSTAVPDPDFLFSYSQQGSYINNYTGIGLAIDLPFFNRNQGNIKAARFTLQQSQATDSIKNSSVQNEVADAYITYAQVQSRVQNIDPEYSKQLDDLLTDAYKNYNKRYINLLDFLDQLRTYMSAKLSLIQLDNNYFNAVQNFNFRTGAHYLK